MRRGILLAIAVVFFSGCKIDVPDLEGCVSLASGGAFCRKMVTKKERRVSRTEWDVDRIGAITLSPKDFGEVVKFIKKVCAQNLCNEAEISEVNGQVKEVENIFLYKSY